MAKSCFLIGFMGSGKTYRGVRLASLLQVGFIDLDQFIERESGQTIPEIFESRGADYFRALERDCLRRLPTDADVVVAVGGGTPCFFDNMDWMNARGLTIFMETNVATLAERLSNETAVRPLLAGRSGASLETFIREMLREREPFYRQAAISLPFRGDEAAYEKQLIEILSAYFGGK